MKKHLRILLGVGGGIAAYKLATVASRLVQQGHTVRVAMTPRACEFIGPLTFEGLTGARAILSSTQIDADGTFPHIAVARAAELFVIAPATADLIARLASGAADDAVSLAALTVGCPKLLVPAMNDAMWENPLLQRNLATLQQLGWQVLGPIVGRLAEGYAAIGRMVEPEQILARIDELASAR